MSNSGFSHTFRQSATVRSALLVVIAGLLVVAASVRDASAAYYHDLEKNRQPCRDCHTLHYSEGDVRPPGTDEGGPFQQLLIRATTNKLCFFCHDGTDPKAPDVLGDPLAQIPIPMYDGSGDEHSGAGFFDNTGGFENLNGHDLGLSAATVPFSSRTNVTLTCASCHDPHGTINYRNVLTSPAGGTGITVEMAKDVYRDQPPGDPPSAAASISAYKESNEGYKARSSLWCAECHDQLKPTNNNPANRIHHLIDVPINGSGYPTDPAHWVGGTGDGFGAITGDETEGIPRLRFQVSGATDYTSARTVATNNEVICLACHMAHGGRHEQGLTWPHKDSGGPVDKDSGCLQCHDPTQF